MSSTAPVVGASRGIGLGPARELLERGWQVTGIMHDPGAAAPLAEAGATSGRGGRRDPDGPPPSAPTQARGRRTCRCSTPASPSWRTGRPTGSRRRS